MVACQKTLFELIESKQDKWYALLDDIWKHPETGYREWRTSALLQKEMEAMGYSPVLFGDIPGFYCDLDTGRPGPTIAVMGGWLLSAWRKAAVSSRPSRFSSSSTSQAGWLYRVAQ